MARDVQARGSIIDRLLRPFSTVKPGEGAQALLMLGCVFLILTSYYAMKTAREGLILSDGTFGLKGDELKTYATGATALLLVGVIPAYGMLANRVARIRLINVSHALVFGSLLVFYVLGRGRVEIGLAYFIWLGLVGLLLIAQFWSYANDLYTEEQGKRLFAIIATGGSLGAIFGPSLAKLADTFNLLLIAGALLLASTLVFNAIERVQRTKPTDGEVAQTPLTGGGGFALVLRDRYLLLIAVMLLVLNLVNTTGEYILSNAVRDHSINLVPATAHAELAGAAREAAITEDRREVIKAFYSDFYTWVNVLSFLIQAFLVSRVIEHLGIRRALFVVPFIVLCAYSVIGAIGGLAMIRIAKTAENALDYSLQNTLRQALFLPSSRAVKYKAKAAIDVFFVRAGDTLSAVLVGVGVRQLALGGRALAFVNVALVAVWLAIVAAIARHYRVLSPDEPKRARGLTHSATAPATSSTSSVTPSRVTPTTA